MSLQKGDDSSGLSDNISKFVINIINIFNKDIKQTDKFNHYVRKIIGHYGFFTILGIVSVFFFLTITKIKVKYRFTIHFITGLLYAIFTEFVLQNITSNRTPAIKDVFIDYAGFLTLSSVVLIIYLIKYNKNKYNT